MTRKAAAFFLPLIFLGAALLTRGGLRWASVALWIVGCAAVMSGLLRPRSRWFGKSLVEAAPQPRVALTFDDGPDPVDTPAILKILEEAGAGATFFIVGEKARRYPEIVRRMAESGHEVEPHSQTHPWWFSLSRASRTRREVRESAAVVHELSGRRPRFFRPPMGHKSLALEEVLAEEGLEMVTWSARSFDTLPKTSSEIRDRLLSKAKPGGILLLHEGARRGQDRPSEAVRALPSLLEGLRAKGLEPVSLVELLEGRR
jgi:peptidoglycan-N-acetylglucosamine deacetylase